MQITQQHGMSFHARVAGGTYMVANPMARNEDCARLAFLPDGTDFIGGNQQGWIRPGDRRVKNGEPNALALLMLEASTRVVPATMEELLFAQGFKAEHGYAGLDKCWKKKDRRNGRIMVYMKDGGTTVERISARGAITHTIISTWAKDDLLRPAAWPAEMAADVPRQTVYMGILALQAMELL